MNSLKSKIFNIKMKYYLSSRILTNINLFNFSKKSRLNINSDEVKQDIVNKNRINKNEFRNDKEENGLNTNSLSNTQNARNMKNINRTINKRTRVIDNVPLKKRKILDELNKKNIRMDIKDEKFKEVIEDQNNNISDKKLKREITPNKQSNKKRKQDIKNLIKDPMKSIDNINFVEDKYAITYYEHQLINDLDIINLRNLMYTYLFTKQKENNSKFYINIDDSLVAEKEAKNEKLQKLLEDLKYLEIKFDINKETSIFQSLRTKEYSKYMSYLLDNGFAYRCQCNTFEKCCSNCKSKQPKSKSTNNLNTFENEFLYEKSDFSVKYIRLDINSAHKFIFNVQSNEKDTPLVEELLNEKLKTDSNYSGLKIPSVNYKEKFINTEELGDFPIYKNFTKEFSPTFKSCIDDEIHNVTHKIENLNYSVEKDFILTSILLFSRKKKYFILPNIRIMNWNKNHFEDLKISTMKKKYIYPEAILSIVFNLGFGNNPIKSINQLSLNKNRFKNMNEELVTYDKALEKFKLYDVYSINCLFSSDMIYFYNNKFSNYIFFKYPKQVFDDFPEKFKEKTDKYFDFFKTAFLNTFNAYSSQINNFDIKTWRKVIKIVIPKILSFEYLQLYSFLFERPKYDSTFYNKNIKFIKSFFKNTEYSILYIHDLIGILSEIDNFKSKNIDRRISEFLYLKYSLNKKTEITNVNFYKSLKLIIAGNIEFDNVSIIADFLGKNETIERCRNFGHELAKINFEDVSLLK